MENELNERESKMLESLKKKCHNTISTLPIIGGCFLHFSEALERKGFDKVFLQLELLLEDLYNAKRKENSFLSIFKKSEKIKAPSKSVMKEFVEELIKTFGPDEILQSTANIMLKIAEECDTNGLKTLYVIIKSGKQKILNEGLKGGLK